jgi:gamma-glutamylcyclotransferase (GGCT)/AIG2-like uncharacterized protein YtfP
MNRSELRSWLEGSGHDSSLVRDMTPAVLDGYDYVWNYYSSRRGCGTANLEHKDGAVVWGVLIEIDESLLRAFDRKKGHPYFYDRGTKRIAVKRAKDGETVQAWVYFANPSKASGKDLRPSRTYKDLLVTAAIYWGFPADQVENLKAWETQ